MSETDGEARERLSKLASKNIIEIVTLKHEVSFLKNIIRTYVGLIDGQDGGDDE